MSKNSEMSFAARLASLTGSAVTKTAGLVDAHPETSKEDAIVKIASMSLQEIMESDAFVAGFEARLEERMAELDAATDELV